MLQTIKKLVRFFMSDNSPNIHCLFPQTADNSNALHWCNGILGRDFPTAKDCILDRLDHCKATISPAHEFLIAYFTLYSDGTAYEMGMIIDRCPAKEIDELPRDAALTSSMASPSSQSLSPSPSPSPSLDRFQATLGKGGKSVAATDRIMIPKLGQRDDLKKLAKETFGTYNTLNTLSVGSRRTSMSAPQFATLLEIAHNLAPTYDLRKHQCYWFALIIFLVVRSRTEGKESSGDKIKQLGRWWYFAPEHTAGDDENVAKDEYEKAQIQLKVSHRHIF